MKTEDLIRALAADAAPSRPVGQGLALALPLGLLATLAIFMAVLGPRPDLGAFAEPLVLAKAALPLALAVAAIGAALRAVRPGASEGGWGRALWIAPGLAAVVLAIGLAVLPPDRWLAYATRPSLFGCMVSIPLLSLPLLGAALLALRRGAPLDARRTGALIGLGTAGIATIVYSLFCTEDSPVFYVLWYGLGILVVARIGAALGPRVLRW
jgi:hypothetical protein